MLKMYQEHAHSGSSVELWEENWRSVQYNQSLQFCAVDPLRPLFERYAKPGTMMLEGGCGLGQYVSYYTAQGVKVIGLDFAQAALNRLNKRVPNLPLCAGDVSALPFADESFDVYYSGGVVEHFESGAEPSIKEAHRVLKKDGVLLISVPYFNPLRRVLMPLKRKLYRKVKNAQVEPTAGANNLNFFQYAYKTNEFQKMLEDAGFRVIKKQGFAVIWGLYELPFMDTKSEVYSSAANKSSQTEEEKVAVPDLEHKKSSLVKRLVVNEDETVPLFGLGVKFMRWATGNMMMYVCIKNKS